MNHFNDQQPDDAMAVASAFFILFIFCLFLFAR